MLSTGFGCVLIRNVETRCDVLYSRLVADDEELLVPPSLPQFLPKGSEVPLGKPLSACAAENDPVGKDVIVFKGFVYSRMDVCSFVGFLPVMSFFSGVCFLVALLSAAYLIIGFGAVSGTCFEEVFSLSAAMLCRIAVLLVCVGFALSWVLWKV